MNDHFTPRQKRFILEYSKKPVGTEAAIAAGYSRNGASRAAIRLLEHPGVREEIEKRSGEIAKQANVDASWVLRQAVELHERCMQEVRPFTNKKGEQLKDEEGNLLFVFNAAGAAKALELVGKHVGVGAFRENIEHAGKGGAPLPTAILQFIVQQTNEEKRAIEV